MIEKCYNNTYNKALRDGNLKGLLINNSLSGVIMTTANNTRNIERGQSRTAKLIYGVGYNSVGEFRAKEGGRNTKAYTHWHNMLRRCYASARTARDRTARDRTYTSCSVEDSWLDFQVFAKWFYGHPYSKLGYELDKDLLHPKNKVYSPETCCFVPPQINSLLLSCGSARGEFPQGVCFVKSKGLYKAQLRIDGKKKNLGLFDCPNEAYQTYKAAKERHVKNKALEWQDRIAENVFQALMNWTLNS